MKRQRRILIVLVSIFSLVAGPSYASMKQAEKVTLTVFAASSLGQTFTTMGKEFESKHPGVTVQFSFLASPTLATQLLAGAPADIFASASVSDMASAKTVVPVSTLFAANRVVLATPLNNKFHINKIVDLNEPGVKWIQCAHIVPCGVAADAALLIFKAHVDGNPGLYPRRPGNSLMGKVVILTAVGAGVWSALRCVLILKRRRQWTLVPSSSSSSP